MSIYSFTHFGTKHLIDDYVSETVNSLEFVARSTDLSLGERHAFFKHFTKVYGRTALCLSGGASLGYFHIGIVKALLENHLLPNVITGSSAGSLIAAMVCCRTDQELKDEVFCAEELHPHLTALADDTQVFPFLCLKSLAVIHLHAK